MAIEFSDRTGEHTGAMIALIPSEQDAARLAMDGGEPVEELHVTLCYLGQAADYTAQEQLSLAAAAAQAAEFWAPIEGEAFAPAYFNPHTQDRETALVYLVGGSELYPAHERMAGIADLMFEGRVPEQHRPWVSHLTVAYGNVWPHEGRDTGASASGSSSSGDEISFTEGLGVPGVQPDPISTATLGLDTQSQRQRDPSGDGTTSGSTDRAVGGRTPYMPQREVRGAHAPDCSFGIAPHGTPRPGGPAGEMLGAPDPILPPEQAGVGSLRSMPPGGDGTLEVWASGKSGGIRESAGSEGAETGTRSATSDAEYSGIPGDGSPGAKGAQGTPSLRVLCDLILAGPARFGRITFDRVRVAFGGQVYDIPLVRAADEVGGDVKPLGQDAEKPVPLGDVEFSESDLGSGPSGDRHREVPDDLQTLRVQTDVYAEACRVDVDMAGLVAAMGAYAPVRFRGPLAPIGTPTGDRRIFPPDTITQATFPQPLRFQRVGLEGHKGAVAVAAITHAEEGTWEGRPHIVGEGYFLDPEIIPEVNQAIHLVANGVSGPSVDLDSFAAAVGEYQGKPILVIQEARQRAATLVAIPAFADLRLELEYPEESDGLVASLLPAYTHPDYYRHAMPQMAAIADSLMAGFTEEGLQEFATTSTKGWDSAPIAPRSATFDADDAVKRIQAWAGIGTDEEDEPKFRSMFLWAKPEQLDQDNVPLGSAGYRLPWGDIFDGKPYLVYHAVYAASALLEGGHGGLPNIPDTDKSKLRNTITKIYSRMSAAFDDPSVRASWDRRSEESAATIGSWNGSLESPPVPSVDSLAATATPVTAIPASAPTTTSGSSARGTGSEPGKNRMPETAGIVPEPTPSNGNTFSKNTMDSPRSRSTPGLSNREGSVESAEEVQLGLATGSISTMITPPVHREECSVANAILPSGTSGTTPTPCGQPSSTSKTEEAVSSLETFASKFGTLYPSKRAFARRDLKGPTKPVVSADGTEYYGHLALWDSCHLGHSGSGVCRKPVHSKVNYKHFYTGTVQTAEGEIVEVGKIMGDGDHAATKRGMSASAVKKYYENTSKVFGLVRLYKDQFGIQFCGVPAPWADEELGQKMRASEISAHWHPIDNHLEVVAAIAVNRPAFAITASAALDLEDLIVDDSTIVLVEDGVQTGLIASARFDEKEAAMAAGGDGEDCGCGESKAQELHAARIMGMDPLPTHRELAERQARLAKHLG